MSNDNQRERFDNLLNKTMDGAYNMALDHAIEVIKQHYLPTHSVVAPILDNIMVELFKMKVEEDNSNQ